MSGLVSETTTEFTMTKCADFYEPILIKKRTSNTWVSYFASRCFSRMRCHFCIWPGDPFTRLWKEKKKKRTFWMENVSFGRPFLYWVSCIYRLYHLINTRSGGLMKVLTSKTTTISVLYQYYCCFKSRSLTKLIEDPLLWDNFARLPSFIVNVIIAFKSGLKSGSSEVKVIFFMKRGGLVRNHWFFC